MRFDIFIHDLLSSLKKYTTHLLNCIHNRKWYYPNTLEEIRNIYLKDHFRFQENEIHLDRNSLFFLRPISQREGVKYPIASTPPQKKLPLDNVQIHCNAIFLNISKRPINSLCQPHAKSNLNNKSHLKLKQCLKKNTLLVILDFHLEALSFESLRQYRVSIV